MTQKLTDIEIKDLAAVLLEEFQMQHHGGEPRLLTVADVIRRRLTTDEPPAAEDCGFCRNLGHPCIDHQKKAPQTTPQGIPLSLAVDLFRFLVAVQPTLHNAAVECTIENGATAERAQQVAKVLQRRIWEAYGNKEPEL